MKLVSIRKAAQELRISDRTLRRAVRRGEIPGYKLGDRTIRVDLEDLQDWVKDKRVRPWDGEPR